MTVRLTPVRTPGSKQMEFHPSSKRGLLVRAEPYGALLIWDTGHEIFPYSDLPGQPSDQEGKLLPVRLRGSSRARLIGVDVVDVTFL